MNISECYRGILYFCNRYFLRRRFLTAHIPELELVVKFKTEDAAGRRMYRRRNYEPHLTKFVRRNVQLGEGDIAIDVGGNLGWFTLLLSRTTEGTIHCFEPDPLNFELLTHNMSVNGVTRASLNQCAVADKEDTMTLYLYPDKNRGRHSLLPINEGETVDVKTIKLDSYCESNSIDPSTVKFVKIDIEGFEPQALRGAASLLQSDAIFLVEYVPHYMEKGGVSISEYLDFMYSFGLEAYKVDQDTSETEKLDRARLLAQETPLDLVWAKGERSFN
ncbi:MAG: FkbM family methyltransferase [Verrucomicrobiales bacterium]|nr:FkbM family methyltransferase [Verrucomicrobiales bacterium]